MPLLDLENYRRIRDLYLLSVPTKSGQDLTKEEYEVAGLASQPILAGMTPEAHYVASHVNRLTRGTSLTRAEYRALWDMCEVFRHEDGEEYWGRAYCVCAFLVASGALHSKIDPRAGANVRVNAAGPSGAAS